MNIFKKSFNELEVGEKWVSRGRTVTETDVVNFCYLSGDWFPLHSNKVYAEQSVFKQRIAHGFLIIAISSGLLIPTDSTTIVANYGMERVRFIAPVCINDTIYCTAEVSTKQPKNDSQGVVDYTITIFNQNEKVVCSYVMKVAIANHSEVE